MSRRFAALILLAILGITSACFLRQRSHAQLFRQLVKYVAEHGQHGTLPREGLEYFGLPTDHLDEVPFRHVTVQAEDHAKTFSVRRRDTRIDVLLSMAYPGHGYFYLASEDGQLIRAAFVGGERRVLENTQEPFEAERAFWLDWWTKQRGT